MGRSRAECVAKSSMQRTAISLHLQLDGVEIKVFLILNVKLLFVEYLLVFKTCKISLIRSREKLR